MFILEVIVERFVFPSAILLWNGRIGSMKAITRISWHKATPAWCHDSLYHCLEVNCETKTRTSILNLCLHIEKGSLVLMTRSFLNILLYFNPIKILDSDKWVNIWPVRILILKGEISFCVLEMCVHPMCMEGQTAAIHWGFRHCCLHTDQATQPDPMKRPRGAHRRQFVT